MAKPKEKMQITADPNKAEAVICIRVADARLVAEGSHREKCMVCAQEVWVSASSPVEKPKVCNVCIVGMMAPH